MLRIHFVLSLSLPLCLSPSADVMRARGTIGTAVLACVTSFMETTCARPTKAFASSGTEADIRRRVVDLSGSQVHVPETQPLSGVVTATPAVRSPGDAQPRVALATPGSTCDDELLVAAVMSWERNQTTRAQQDVAPPMLPSVTGPVQVAPTPATSERAAGNSAYFGPALPPTTAVLAASTFVRRKQQQANAPRWSSGE